MSTQKVNTRKSILVRAYIAVALILLFAFYLILGIGRLQFGKSGEFAQAQKIKTTRTKEIQALRGNIYARRFAVGYFGAEIRRLHGSQYSGINGQIIQGEDRQSSGIVGG